MKHAALAGVLLMLPAMAEAQEAALPSWMAGCWEMQEGERWADECWTAPRAGMMTGTGRSGRGEAITNWEFMRIERSEAAGGLTFSASPGGAGWTAFASTPDPAGGVTFVNTANDYPQRVRYWREGELLRAEVSLGDGARSVRWTFRRMAGG